MAIPLKLLRKRDAKKNKKPTKRSSAIIFKNIVEKNKATLNKNSSATDIFSSHFLSLATLLRNAIFATSAQLVAAGSLEKFYAYNDTVTNNTLYYQFNIQNPALGNDSATSVLAELADCGLLEIPRLNDSFCNLPSVSNALNYFNDTFYQFLALCNQTRSTIAEDCVADIFNPHFDTSGLSRSDLIAILLPTMFFMVCCSCVGFVCIELSRFSRKSYHVSRPTSELELPNERGIIQFREKLFNNKNWQDIIIESENQPAEKNRNEDEIIELEEVVVDTPSLSLNYR